MSADIWFEGVACCDSHNVNVTHNLAPMFRAAGVDWRTYTGGPGRGEPPVRNSTAERLRVECLTALALMEADPERFKDLNPPNGWGDYDGAMQVLRDLLRVCAIHPDARIQVSL